jgi:hypothetical protein
MTYPSSSKTAMTEVMLSLNSAGLCVPFDEIHPKTRRVAKEIRDTDNGVYALIAAMKDWADTLGVHPGKLAPALYYIGEAAQAINEAHVELLKVCHDRGIKVQDGGGGK